MIGTMCTMDHWPGAGRPLSFLKLRPSPRRDALPGPTWDCGMTRRLKPWFRSWLKSKSGEPSQGYNWHMQDVRHRQTVHGKGTIISRKESQTRGGPLLLQRWPLEGTCRAYRKK